VVADKSRQEKEISLYLLTRKNYFERQKTLYLRRPPMIMLEVTATKQKQSTNFYGDRVDDNNFPKSLSEIDYEKKDPC